MLLSTDNAVQLMLLLVAALLLVVTGTDYFPRSLIALKARSGAFRGRFLTSLVFKPNLPGKLLQNQYQTLSES